MEREPGELHEQIRRLAGRLVLGRLPGTVLDNEHKQALQDGTLGGITLFKDNATDLEQLAKLTGDIIEASRHIPVLTVDQEGGAVQRFDHVISALPSPMALAALDKSESGDREIIEKITAISARQLKALGFNMLLAPTLDLQTNARNPIICTRAYGDEAESVAKIGSRVAAEIEARGLIAVGKHFPGHGSTAEDSHLQLACVDKSEAELLASDLVPFARLTEQLRAMLIGHIWLPQLVSTQCPATLSPVVIKNILQDKLNFDGLVVSDDMIMKAITEGMGLGEACVQAVLAGVDLLLVCGTFAQSMEAVNALAEAVGTGRLSRERLQQAAAKIDALMTAKPAYIDATDEKAMADFASTIETDNALSSRTSAQAIAVLSGALNEETLAKIKAAKSITVIAPAHPRYPMALAADLRDFFADETRILDIRYPVNLTSDTIHESLAAIFEIANQSSELTIFLSYRSAINIGQKALADALVKRVTPDQMFIHVATDSPYDITYLPGVEKFLSLATFDPSCQAISGLAAVLLGQEQALGRSPVAIAQ